MKTKKIRSNPTSNFRYENVLECGTSELRRKHRVEWETLDMRGHFRRARVLDQNYIDTLFLEKKISAAQYSAAEEYLALLVKAGCFLMSPGFEEGVASTGSDKSRAMASRIMAISGARSRLRRDCSSEVRLAVDLAIGSNAKVHIVPLRKGLNVLADYFGTAGDVDPRSF